MSECGFVAVLVIDLHFPSAGSLKAKRRELASIKGQMQARLGVAISEVAFQDRWQRARLTVALTGGTASALTAAADGVERWVLARWPEGVHVRRGLQAAEELLA